MIKAILLDLDNTLVLFDETAFYLRYMERIMPYFADIVPQETFRDRLLRGIRGLAQNDGSRPNSHHFMDIFCENLDGSRAVIWDRFMAFYTTEYDQIPVAVELPAGLMSIIDQLDAWQLRLVVATNPLFPKIAQEKRMAWAGLEPARFELLTHLENMSFVKPRAGYYHQICDRIGLPPHQCLMVGNDAVNDMVAGTVGMKTYLTTEAGKIDYGAVTKGRNVRRGESHTADFSGPLAGVPAAVAQLRREM